MKRLIVAAAALAAGMLTIVAQSQAESDRNMFRTAASAKTARETSQPDARTASEEARQQDDETATGKQAKLGVGPAKARKAPKQAKKDMERQDVDAGKTASTARVRPELVATARKSVRGLDGGSLGKTAANAGSYTTLVSRYATTYGVPVSLAQAVIRVESNYRPNARGSAGEVGLMQIKPATARMMGYTGGASGLFNPETNIKYGMKYLGLAHQLSGGTTCGTVLRYNAGHAARRMNPVSAAYCSKVKRHLAG